MKTLIMMLLIPLLISTTCQAPRIKPQIVCDYSYQFDRCRCRCYDNMKLKRVPPIECNQFFDEEEWEISLHECDGLTGWFIDDVNIEVLPWAKKTRQYYKDKCDR